MSDSSPVIASCRNLVKFFGGVCALNDVSVDLHRGEVICLVGDNGAGKSTFAKMLSGLVQPDMGTITVAGTEVRNLTPHHARELGIEIVYQHLALCDNLNAVENVMLGQEPVRFSVWPLSFIDRRRAKEEARRRIEAVGSVIPDLDIPVRRMSGGQRQAIAIARATVRGHRIIVLDEPTAALGVRQRELTLKLARSVADSGVAVLMITHNLDDVFSVGDRVIAFRRGEVVMDSTVSATSREDVIAIMTGLTVAVHEGADDS